MLRGEIQKGLDDVKRGRVVSPERAFAACRQRAQEEMSRFELASPRVRRPAGNRSLHPPEMGVDAQAARYREELELALQHRSLQPDAGRKRDAISSGPAILSGR